jgi:hypothetical protein
MEQRAKSENAGLEDCSWIQLSSAMMKGEDVRKDVWKNQESQRER